jgi:hypothetical protein
MYLDEAADVVCRCGHARVAHEHYRAGTQCALCIDCPRFRPSGGTLRRLAAGLLRRASPRW